jgi:anti-anti-sigma factor
MPIEFEDSSETLRTIRISGRLDLIGTDEIATKFAALSTVSGRQVIVDLTEVSFLASIGIRSIITNAKALQQRGGRMVLFVGNNQSVAKTLETTGIDSLIPLFSDKAEAEKAVAA